MLNNLKIALKAYNDAKAAGARDVSLNIGIRGEASPRVGVEVVDITSIAVTLTRSTGGYVFTTYIDPRDIYLVEVMVP